MNICTEYYSSPTVGKLALHLGELWIVNSTALACNDWMPIWFFTAGPFANRAMCLLQTNYQQCEMLTSNNQVCLLSSVIDSVMCVGLDANWDWWEIAKETPKHEHTPTLRTNMYESTDYTSGPTFQYKFTWCGWLKTKPQSNFWSNTLKKGTLTPPEWCFSCPPAVRVSVICSVLVACACWSYAC